MKKKTILALGLAVAMTVTAMPAAAAELDIQSAVQEETADFSDEAADVEIGEEESAAETDEASVEVEADEDAEATALEVNAEDFDETSGADFTSEEAVEEAGTTEDGLCEWGLENGILTITYAPGADENPDSSESWVNRRDEVKTLVIKDSCPGKAILGDFEDYKNLTTVNLQYTNASSVEIGGDAFKNCTSLQNITLPEKTVEIKYDAFNGCTSLKSINLPEGLEYIGERAFKGCTSLESITTPSTLIYFEPSVFEGCTGLKKVTIAEGPSNIGRAAFMYCSSLTEITLPSTVTGTDLAAFTGCSNLTKMIILSKEFVLDRGTFGGTPIKDIYYVGSQSDWDYYNFADPEDYNNATIHYNYDAAHAHVYETKTTPATCEKGGKVEQICKICGYVGNTQYTLAAGHSYTTWSTIQEATVVSTGRQVRNCKRCGEKSYKTTSKLQPTIKTLASSVKLKTGQKTTAYRVSGFAKGDYVVSWKSSNTKIVTVNGNADGKCTIKAGKKKGKANITVTLRSGLRRNLAVTVQKTAVKTTKIYDVPSKLNLARNKTYKLAPTRFPITSVQKITYKSSNKKVATVSSKGVIKGKKKGTAVITVRCGGKSVKCRVTVK